MYLILLRHGKTNGNIAGRYIGRTDEPLCPEGICEAKRAGIVRGIDNVYVSPMLRAKQTASICFPNANQIIIDDLREMDFGAFEGRTADDMRDDTAYRQWVDGNCEGPCPGGESFSYFSKRVCGAFSEIVRKAISDGEKYVVIIAHGGTIMAIMESYAGSAYAGESGSFYQWHVPHCCGWKAELNENTWDNCPKLTDCTYFERLE